MRITNDQFRLSTIDLIRHLSCRHLTNLDLRSQGDIFPDFESDTFVKEGGFEYLLGYVLLEATDQPEYVPMWAP